MAEPEKNKLEYSPKNCWEVYNEPEHIQSMDQLAERYLDFLGKNKTEREVVAYALERAKQAGFVEGFQSGADKCFQVLRGKTAFLARRGRCSLEQGFRLLAAHGDAPRLDLKQRPLTDDLALCQAKTHYYGGIRKYQWLARPLAIHGVVALKSGRVIPVVLGEAPGEPVFSVIDLLPHLAAKQNEKKLSDAFEGEKLTLVMGHRPEQNTEGKGRNLAKARVLSILNQKYGIDEEDLYSAELEAVPAGPAVPVGLDGSLLGGYGQDDRICVFCGLEAMLESPAAEFTQCLIIWDKEETGSEGATGAGSRFLEYCLNDMIRAWEPQVLFSRMITSAKALSGDVHAAMDPDYQDLHDKQNAALVGYGPCFCKFTGHRGKYAANDADAEYVAWVRQVLDKAGIPWQMAELGKVDLGGGGTVAKFLASQGMEVIDCGPAVLSMHSPFEISSKVDLYATTLAYKAFLIS